MRVLIVAVGSRGDVAPCAGLGTALRDAGHSVMIAGYEQHSSLVLGCGLEFQALPGDPRLLEAARWQRGGTGPLGAARLVRLIADHLREVHQGIITAARQGAEVLPLQGISTIGGYHIAEGLGLPSMGLGLRREPDRRLPALDRDRPVSGPVGQPGRGPGPIALGGRCWPGPSASCGRAWVAPAGHPRGLFGDQDPARWPVFHGYSPAVLPRPADWRPGLEVVGYWWPPRPARLEPAAGPRVFSLTRGRPRYSSGSVT